MLGQRTDGGFVPLVIGPLTDAPDFHQTRTLQRREVVGHGRLRQSDAFLDAADTHADRVDVTFVLGREMLLGILQTFEDLETRAIREGFEYFEQVHGREYIGIFRYAKRIVGSYPFASFNIIDIM